MKRHILLLLLLFCTVFTLPLSAKNPKAREIWMKGYVALEEGGKAEEGGDIQLSFNLYNKALDHFRSVQQRYPAWNPSLLSYRISFCETRIQRLQTALGRESKNMKKEELGETVQAQITKVNELTDENRRLRLALDSSRSALERARREAARSVGKKVNIDELVNERKQFMDELAASKAECRRLSGELAAIREAGGLEAIAKKLQGELERLKADRVEVLKNYNVYRKAYENTKEKLVNASKVRDRAIEIAKQLKLRTENAEKQREAMQTALSSFQEKWENFQGENGRLKQELANNKSEAEEATAQLLRAKGELAELRKYRDQALENAGKQGKLLEQVQELLGEKAKSAELVASLRSELEKTIQGTAAVEEENKKTLQTAKLEVSQLKKDLGIEKRTRETLAGKLQTLETDKQNLTEKWESLQKEKATLASKLKLLEEEKTAVEREQKKANEKVAELQERLNTEKSSTKAQERFAKGEATKLLKQQETLEELQKTKEMLEAKAKSLEQKTAQQDKLIEALQKQGAGSVKAEELAKLQSSFVQQNAKLKQEMEENLKQTLAQEHQKQLLQLAQTQKKLEEEFATASKNWDEERQLLTAKLAETKKQAEATTQKEQQEVATEEKLREELKKLELEKETLAKSLSDASGKLLESQKALAGFEAEKLEAEKQSKALETSSKKQLETATAELDQERLRAEIAERKYKANLVVLEEQKNLLASQKQRLDELAGMGKLLGKREEELAELQKKQAEVSSQMRKATAISSNLEEQTRVYKFESQRLARRLAAAEKIVQDLTVKLEQEQRDAKRNAASPKDEEALQASQNMIKTLESEQKQLENKNSEQLKLLKAQEKAIAKLEQEQKQNALLLAAKEQETKRLSKRIDLMKSQSEVVEGLTESLTEADAKLLQLKQEVEKKKQEAEEVRRRLEKTEDRLTLARREVDSYQSNDPKAKTSSVLRERIRRLTLQLERETQRRRTMEAILSRQEAAPAEPELPVAPAPATMTPDRPKNYSGPEFSELAERDRRERQNRLLVRGYLKQGIMAEKSNNVEAARWNYGKALKLDPNNKPAAQRLGLIAAEVGDDREAIIYLKRAFRLDPDDLDTLLSLGFALVRQTEPDLAISMLSRAIALEPDNPHAHRCLGLACSTLGWNEAAEVQFRRTHKLNPKDAENAFNLAVLLASNPKNPRMEEARTWYLLARKLGAAGDPGLEQVFGIKSTEGK